jgi:hypothetical protein
MQEEAVELLPLSSLPPLSGPSLSLYAEEGRAPRPRGGRDSHGTSAHGGEHAARFAASFTMGRPPLCLCEERATDSLPLFYIVLITIVMICTDKGAIVPLYKGR